MFADVDGFSTSIDKHKYCGCNDPAAISPDGHKRQYADILAAIRGEKNLSYTATDAAETVKLITSIYESSKTQKEIKL